MSRPGTPERPPSVLGPWPLAPGATFALLLLVTFLIGVRSGLSLDTRDCVRGCWVLPEALLPQWGGGVTTSVTLDPVLVFTYPLAVSAGAGLILLAITRWRGLLWLRPANRVRYAMALAVGALAGSASGALFVAVVGRPSVPGSLVVTAVRLWVLLMVLHWIVGRFSFTYIRAAKEATSAVADLTQQRWQIVDADEKVRREVAAYLHDHVQADLLVLAMRLRKVSDQIAPDPAAEVNEIVEELERVRRVGVRGAGQRLSPDVAGMGLLAAVNYLAASWRPAFDVRVGCSNTAERRLTADDITPVVPTAIYRVVEQALLNSAAHGVASRVDISIDVVDGVAEVSVADDGRGMGADGGAEAPAGSGTAVSNAWMDIVHGSWTRTARDSGVLVTIRVPVDTA